MRGNYYTSPCFFLFETLFADMEVVLKVIVEQNKIIFINLVETLDLVSCQLGEVEVRLGCRVPDASHSVDPRN